MIDPVLDHLHAHESDAVARLCDWLAIPSVSTDPAYADDMQRGAQWAADRLAELGLTPRIMPTAGHPAVVARTGDSADDVLFPGAPRLLFYGHYDVQPADPVDKWTTPPFAPTVRDTPDGPAVFARGALDDKGQTATMLEACRAWKAAHGKLPVPITFLIEGEEEIGSINLPPFIEQHKDLLAADVAVVCDTGMWAPGPGSAQKPVPAITYALRGLVYFDVKLHGPSRDLHSGMFGGTLPNPHNLLTRVLGKLFDDDNRIAIPGFYDDVAPPEDEERALWEQLGFDEQAFLDGVGAEPFGEAGFSTLARRWARPSCDINGLYGGYGGAGAKTVIASFAGAKVSFRIPANMDPRKVAKQFTDWIHAHDVAGCRWELTSHGEAWPVATPLDSPYVAAARRAIEAAAGRPAALIREGATIPIVADFQKTLGVDTLLIGFGLEGDNIHSPDEHFGLDRFHLGCRTNARLLSQIARVNS